MTNRICSCTHGLDDHAFGSPGSAAEQGVCFEEGCDCREYREVREDIDPMPVMTGTQADRDRIIRRLKKLRGDIEIDLNTVEYWNTVIRPEKWPDAEPIDPDPFGELRRMIAAIDELLANDPGHGPIAPLNFERSH